MAAVTLEGARVHLSHVHTPIGPMLMGTTAEHLCLLEFADRRTDDAQPHPFAGEFRCVYAEGRNEIGRLAADELEAYFEGTLRDFRVPVLTLGTEFQRRSWAALRRIPYGETRSYGEQAVAIGSPDAVRAVARANGQNRIAIVVPCHRVIGADGGLTGYGGGLWRKRWLLRHEGVALADEPDPAQETLAL